MTTRIDFVKIGKGDSMTLNFSGNILDIMILIILGLSFIIGYKKGIVDRVLHFASTLLIFGVSWFLSKPTATFFTHYQISGIDQELMQYVAPIIGRVIGFVVIFIILSIIRSIIFVLLHAIIENIKKHLSLVRFVDNGFGAIFNVAKNTLLVYVILLGMCMPVFTNGMTIVNESKLGGLILNVSPSLSHEIMTLGDKIVTFTQVEQWANKDFEMKDMVDLVDAMMNLGMFDEADLEAFYQNYQSQIDSIPTSVVDKERYDELMELIEQLPANEQLKNVARSKITVTP